MKVMSEDPSWFTCWVNESYMGNTMKYNEKFGKLENPHLDFNDVWFFLCPFLSGNIPAMFWTQPSMDAPASKLAAQLLFVSSNGGKIPPFNPIH